MTTAASVIEEIAAERARQISEEGWTPEHDNIHSDGQMARAAACYAYFASLNDEVRGVSMFSGSRECLSAMPVLRRLWQWGAEWWKPKERRRDLVRAAALIVAEIERLDRATQRTEAA